MEASEDSAGGQRGFRRRPARRYTLPNDFPHGDEGTVSKTNARQRCPKVFSASQRAYTDTVTGKNNRSGSFPQKNSNFEVGVRIFNHYSTKPDLFFFSYRREREHVMLRLSSAPVIRAGAAPTEVFRTLSCGWCLSRGWCFFVNDRFFVVFRLWFFYPSHKKQRRRAPALPQYRSASSPHSFWHTWRSTHSST